MPLSKKRFAAYTFLDLERERIPMLAKLPQEVRFAMRVTARVLPFRVNRYVVEELIDWDQVPQDPLFQLTFPQPGMLAPEDFASLAELIAAQSPEATILAKVHQIRKRLNPHPGGQLTLNVPRSASGDPLGLQHKYRQTVLFFPRAGQTCHSYCSFCFRWAQFVGKGELRIAGDEQELQDYLRRHPEISDVLLTGGDPMVMRANRLARCLLPLLAPEFEHVQSIRIGTKSLSFWPYRYLTDEDAEDLLRLLEKLVQGGKHLTLMAHYNHFRELETEPARQAIARIRATGAVIRAQGPVLAHVNDDPKVWARMWQTQVSLGIIPYYLFVARDTGARRYFALPLARCLEIYRLAAQRVCGLALTVRGPVMSTAQGKVEIQGVSEIGGEKVFVLRFLKARDPAWEFAPFFARFDPHATWLDQLRPAFGQDRFGFAMP
jgi:L-lysine 2,3-aminomutase